MTLGDFFSYLDNNPYFIIYYFCATPFAAFLANMFGKGEGHLNPWCIFYSVLIYLVAIPGVFSIILNLYHLLFERQSIYETQIIAQILPIVSMVFTFYIIKKNVEFKEIPGFGKLVNLLSTIAGMMVILFILEKMRIIVFSYIPFIWIIGLLIVLFFAIRFGTKNLFDQSKAEKLS